jgi:hypothetical protein
VERQLDQAQSRPGLNAVDDRNNVTLVIRRADGKQTSKPGYKFDAARDTVLLRQNPRRYFSLNSCRTDQSVIQNWKPLYTSGSSPSKVPNLPDLSAEVHWDLTRDSNGSLVGGSDLSSSASELCTRQRMDRMERSCMRFRSPIRGFTEQLVNQRVWRFRPSSGLAGAEL